MTAQACPSCGDQCPQGQFCGTCGARLGATNAAYAASPSARLRLGAFVMAPRENVLWPALTSSLFPRLPRPSRTRFRVALILLIGIVFGLAGLQQAAALIAVGALWLLILLVMYLHESEAAQRLSRRSLIFSCLLGIVLGAGWITMTGELIARAYDLPIATGLSAQHLLREGVLIPVGGMILMIVPAVVGRLCWPGTRASLDGFTFGALGAASFTGAAALARYAPQLATGLLHRDRPTLGLVVEAGINGVTVPITGTAAGGLIGVALWYSGPRRRTRLTLFGLSIFALGIFVAEGIIDIHGAPDPPTLGLHAVLTCLTVVALRIALQIAVLTEPHKHDSLTSAQCVQCQQTPAGGTFCSHCGALLNYPIPSRHYPPSILRMAVPVTTVIAVALGSLFASEALVTQKTPFYQCPPDCGKPPMGTPVATNPRFTAPNGDFAVSYPAPDSAYRVTLKDNGVRAEFTAGDTGVLELFSQPTRGRNAPEIVKELLQQRFPGAQIAYEIPNAMVGYESGYGLVADAWPVSGMYTRVRIVVLAAVKHDLALIAGAAGPYHPYGPDFGPGKPTGTNLQIALDMGKYVNSFSWKGDPPR